MFYRLLYSTDQRPYSLKDLSSSSINHWIKQLETNKEMFAAYYSNNWVGNQKRLCLSACKNAHICSMKYSHWLEYLSCYSAIAEVDKKEISAPMMPYQEFLNSAQ